MFVKYYNKRIKFYLPVVLVALLVLYQFKLIWLVPLDQNRLSAQAIDVHNSVFNPKRTTNYLYNHIVSVYTKKRNLLLEPSTEPNENGVFFHWDDYVDTSAGDSMLGQFKQDNAEGICDDKTVEFAAFNSYWLESYNTKVLRSMTNLFCSKDIPNSVFVPTENNYIQVPVTGRKRFGEKLNATIDLDVIGSIDDLIPSTHNQQQQNQKINELNDFNIYPIKSLNKSVDINVNDFYFDPQYEMFKLNQLKQDDKITKHEMDYYNFLKYANSIVDDSDRYFKYPWIYTDVVQGSAHHLATPFFKRYIPIRERQSVIHHMIRAWFQFAEAIDVPSWVNYGSLLGWAYNGINMPWDTDVDIQLSIRHLDYLSQHYNNSLILEHPSLGNAKYLLDISPTYIRQGNGRNFIDGRFIDINSGLYIDISAVSHTNFKPPKDLELSQDSNDVLVHCKHFNWHALSEILPLRHTYFEGSSIYIPSNISSILTRKYGRESFTTKSHFMDYNYQQDINLWVPDDTCESSPDINRFETTDAGIDYSALTFKGACKSKILKDEYKINYNFVQRHQSLDKDIDRPVDYNIDDLKDLPLTRKDPWQYYNDINGGVNSEDWYFEYN